MACIHKSLTVTSFSHLFPVVENTSTIFKLQIVLNVNKSFKNFLYDMKIAMHVFLKFGAVPIHYLCTTYTQMIAKKDFVSRQRAQHRSFVVHCFDRISLFPKFQVYGKLLQLYLGYKTFFMLNSGEHEIYPAHKC